MTEKERILRDLRRRIDRFIDRTLRDVRVELLKEFDRNFEREAFFNERWARRKHHDDRSRGLLVRTGTLRRSLRAEVTDCRSVRFFTDVPYARIHNEGGTITVTISDDAITMVLADRGPGIPDIDQAMQEGFSTARPEVRSLGFGAGMGLPNMKRFTDEMKIDTVLGKGTTITMKVNLHSDGP